MAQYVALRALSRTVKIRVKDSSGSRVTLSNVNDTVVDLDDVEVRRALGHHSAIGQYVVSAANASVNNDGGAVEALPANS